MASSDLLQAAYEGDVELLRESVASNKPTSYYQIQPVYVENILHAAVRQSRVNFMREAIRMLHPETIQVLLLEQHRPSLYTPLHLAAQYGNIDMVNLILGFYKSLPSLPPRDQRPWLSKTKNGYTPCVIATSKGQEDCALEIWKMDMDLLSNTQVANGIPLFPFVVFKGFHRWALEMLRSPFQFSCRVPKTDTTALHCLHSVTEEEICTGILKRDPEQITHIISKNGDTILHNWAKLGKLWLFECLLKSTDIIPQVRRIFVKLMSTPNIKGLNPLHILAQTVTISDQVAAEIAKFLINTYKQEEEERTSSSSSEEYIFPWLMEDQKGFTPLSYAIENRKEELAMLILSEDNNAAIKTTNALLFAIENRCRQVATKILYLIDEKGWTGLLTNQDRQTAMHLAPLCGSKFVGLTYA